MIGQHARCGQDGGLAEAGGFGGDEKVEGGPGRQLAITVGIGETPYGGGGDGELLGQLLKSGWIRGVQRRDDGGLIGYADGRDGVSPVGRRL